jgi:hypothetical protein
MRDAHTGHLYALGTDQQWGAGRREASLEVDRQLNPLQEANEREVAEHLFEASAKARA